jgi:hypothetical protein
MVNGEEKDMMKEAAKGKGPRGKGKEERGKGKRRKNEGAIRVGRHVALEKENNFVSGLLAFGQGLMCPGQACLK